MLARVGAALFGAEGQVQASDAARLPRTETRHRRARGPVTSPRGCGKGGAPADAAAGGHWPRGCAGALRLGRVVDAGARTPCGCTEATQQRRLRRPCAATRPTSECNATGWFGAPGARSLQVACGHRKPGRVASNSLMPRRPAASSAPPPCRARRRRPRRPWTRSAAPAWARLQWAGGGGAGGACRSACRQREPEERDKNAVERH